ncbi:MAG: hypothetical protein FWD97_04370 [Defluviitaleaceae bacterium]|nr:hypothetical protein [Defluviitaleaceae bacterium]
MDKGRTIGAIKNIILVVLALTCLILVVRLWFGEFPPSALVTVAEGTAAMGINPWDEASAGLMLTSARLHIRVDGAEQFVYAGLSNHKGWQLSTSAISQLIERGNFVADGAVVLASNTIAIQYNFPMPSAFFRENFGVRPGFLSSHFDDFEKLYISPRQGGFDFVFVSQTSGNFMFVLENTALYWDFIELFADVAYEAETNTTPTGEIQYKSPIGTLSLSEVNPHIGFLFPNPAVINQASINGIFTFSDNLRVARFFPDHVVEFNAMPSSGLSANPNVYGNFTSSLLIAFDIISRDNLGNGIILASYHHDPTTGRWHFYFDYTLADVVVTLDKHPLQVQILHRDVVFYRRLMLDFFEVEASDYGY